MCRAGIDLYDEPYFKHLSERVRRSAAMIVPEIVGSFAPSSALDIGCGDGQWAIALAKEGIRTVGIDSAEIVRDTHPLATFLHRDLTQVEPGSLATVDICICLEVAEHLPPEAADSLVAVNVASSDLVLFSAATPGQGGTGHLNEQPHDYWISRFAAHGFQPDEAWRERFAGCPAVAPWYRQNMIVFRASRS